MTEFLINHTCKRIIPAERDAGFNITKTLRWTVRQYGWSLDDHIEYAISDRITHPYGVELIVKQKYELLDWAKNLRHFMSTGSREYRDIMLCEYGAADVGPFGV